MLRKLIRHAERANPSITGDKPPVAEELAVVKAIRT